MPNTKTIAINPDFFSVKKKNKTKKRERKRSSNKKMKPNSIKKDLIAKIKEHQKNKELEKKNLGNDEDSQKKKEDLEFANSLQNSIEYLESISKKVEQEKLEKKRQKKSGLSNNDLQEIEIKTDTIPYSNMKNGSKPSYSQWRKTQKQNSAHKEPLQFKFNVGDSPIHDDSFDERQKKLNEVKAKFNMSPLPSSSSNDKPSLVGPVSLPGNEPEVNLQKKKKRIKKKTRKIKRKFYLGKNKNKKTCGVLIKNKKTRKNIKKEVTKLKSRSIGNIKKYLRKHNLMKIGSSIPDEVAREIYENAYLAGDVYNKNADVLFHNYTHN